MFIQIVVRVSDVYMTSYAQIDLLKAEALNTIFRILSIRQDDEEVTLKILNDLVDAATILGTLPPRSY